MSGTWERSSGGSIPIADNCPACLLPAGIRVLDWLRFDASGRPIAARVMCLLCGHEWDEFLVPEKVVA